MSIHNNETFGLLGPNGAGKTTAISVVTGLFAPSGGTAKVAGFDIRSNMHNVEQLMGITPQFDIVWPAMSVREHLRFYAGLKGVSYALQEDIVQQAAEAVGLSGQWLDTAAQDLSGGMRRRLSLSMSLVGNPEVLFLDEPSTGLDPETKRHMWRLIEKAKPGRAIVLTTHSMEEADALCDRIGIMALGELQCIGSSLHLKKKFGAGYKLDVTFSPPDKKTDVFAFVKSIAPASKLVENYMGRATFEIERSSIRVSELFDSMLNRPQGASIDDWGIRMTSLEEVFLRIAEESELQK
eukprot:Plantae.Rhodophyta-Rhodochaete_pulchella.ctg2050.p1 GENE.Plantae.Rhodophyta-Rhodochaete_pulchella.ctg2050~~Plantae.Rhodophyta-Rhodochaete_pulchella.ctg2050.p1  ORF type:complete len:339 (+),score=55.68 Plantae.Rhodophyta-Rhodochaete_pulchella.ctg2050:135-1019(+)